MEKISNKQLKRNGWTYKRIYESLRNMIYDIGKKGEDHVQSLENIKSFCTNVLCGKTWYDINEMFWMYGD